VTLTVSPAKSAEERARAHSIRHRVFVEEQAVPAEVEIDGLDDACDHFLAWLDGQAVATARARVTSKGWKLERVAVLRDHRKSGVGAALVRRALAAAPLGVTIYVHAQDTALGFWERAGFVERGSGFEEGGISHRLIVLAATAGKG
jgi:predicted GNAT family N-acyltransferase